MASNRSPDMSYNGSGYVDKTARDANIQGGQRVTENTPFAADEQTEACGGGTWV